MSPASLAAAAGRLRGLGVTRVESYAWRDLDDPDAGGSELHADEIFTRWAAAGVEIEHRTSAKVSPRRFERNGYTVHQRGGRFDVFVRVALRQLVRRRPSSTATIEIWNGVPWFGPVWAPRRRVVWMHHVHREMWNDALPRPFSDIGRFVETRIAPWCYRRSRFATLSPSSAEEIEEIGIPAAHLTVIPPGVHERFVADPAGRSPDPVVLIVGRLAPVKRQRATLEALAAARLAVPGLRVRLVGDGPDREAIEAWIATHDAAPWVTVLGRVPDDQLVAEYQAAWLVVSGSLAEGWGMSLTEAGACGTPGVATDIPGHREALVHGVTGHLVADVPALGPAVVELLGDADRRASYGAAAIEHAASLTWNAVAAQQLELLCDAIEVTSRRHGTPGDVAAG